jgi:hypothetical protein
VIWFEERVPKSTPTNSNPFDSSGNYTGNLNIHILHVVKARRILANSEITKIQSTLLDTYQTIPAPPAPPVGNTGTFITETPSGTRNASNVTFTLSQNPDLNTLLIFCFGIGALERVSSNPGTMEFVAGGTGNRTITMGLGPDTGYPFIANYRVSA